jgi:3-hydroxyisobutyrate dehydrogenase
MQDCSVTIGFLGLGVMGGGMAGRLLDAGQSLLVWNRRRERAEPFTARGARLAATPRDAAAGANVVMAMVADDAASRAVWLGDDGAVAGLRQGAIAIESSTVSPRWIDDLATAVAARGGTLLDAPVTGSRTHAGKGELRFLVGGPADAVDRARPVLSALGREIVQLGPTGAGARMKLINNFVCGAQAAALAEGLALIEASGLNPADAMQILTNGAPGSPLVNTVGPRMAGRDYTVNFSLALMDKDLRYAIEEAKRFGLDLRTAATARALFDDALAAGLGEQDFSAVIEPLRRQRA